MPSMKTIRVPWIRCRADEAGALPCKIQWRDLHFVVLAYSEKEAIEWWSGLSDFERAQALGLGDDPAGDSPGLL
jgi:hypothetical protein